MRRIAALLFVLGLLNLGGCSLVRDFLFDGLARHHSAAYDPVERRRNLDEQTESWRGYQPDSGG